MSRSNLSDMSTWKKIMSTTAVNIKQEHQWCHSSTTISLTHSYCFAYRRPRSFGKSTSVMWHLQCCVCQLLQQWQIRIARLQTLLLYKTLVLPILLYCGSIWHPSNACHLNRIEAVQRRATRILYWRKFAIDKVTYEDRLKHFNIISIKHNLALQRLTLGHKVVHGHSPPEFNAFIRPSNHVPGRTQAFNNSPFVHFARLWTDLPLDLQEIPSVKSFCKSLSEHFLSTC